MTYIFKGVSSGLGEEQDDTREHDYEIHRREESICSPSDTVEHGSSDHDLRISDIISNQSRHGRTTKKFHSQLLAVLKAFAGARIRRGVTSAGYSQVIPSQPIENQVLNKKRQRTEMT